MSTAGESGERLAHALIQVVEAARWEAKIKSVRELAARADMTHTSLNARMSGQVVFNARDIGALAHAFDMSPVELIVRAKKLAEESDRAANVSSISDADLAALPSAAEPQRRDDGTSE